MTAKKIVAVAAQPLVGVFGNFRSANENVFYNYDLLLYTSGNKATVSIAHRANIAASDQAFFDTLLFTLRQAGKEIDYVDNFNSFFDISPKLKAFLATGDAQGVDLTPEEIAAKSTMDAADAAYLAATKSYETAKETFAAQKKSVQDKFKAKFGKPAVPYDVGSVPSIDIDKVFGTYAEEIRGWMTGVRKTVSWDAREPTRLSSEKNNVLRVTKTMVQNLTDHSLTMKQAETVARESIKLWAQPVPYIRYREADPVGNLGRFYLTSYGDYVTVMKDHVRIGCQRIPRAEVERIAKLQGWV